MNTTKNEGMQTKKLSPRQLRTHVKTLRTSRTFNADEHAESGCTDYLQHTWESCPENKTLIKPTPAPWQVHDDEGEFTIKAPWSSKVKAGEFEGYGDYRGGTICKLEHQGEHAPVVSKRQALANARLIAAAPDLLAALKWVASYVSTSDVNARKVVESAIAKATGNA